MIPALVGLILGPIAYTLARGAKGPWIPTLMQAVAWRGCDPPARDGSAGGCEHPRTDHGDHHDLRHEQSTAIIPTLMTACVISTLVTFCFARDSIYTQKYRRRGVNLASDQDPNVPKALFVRDILDRHPEVVPVSAGFSRVVQVIVESSHSEFLVENEDLEVVMRIFSRGSKRATASSGPSTESNPATTWSWRALVRQSTIWSGSDTQPRAGWGDLIATLPGQQSKPNRLDPGPTNPR